MSARTTPCGARTVFWPDVEAIDAECIRPRGHEPAKIHEDEILGEWNEDELTTYRPEPDEDADTAADLIDPHVNGKETSR